MKLVYMGTPDFAVPALTALFNAGHEILAVVTQPDRKRGRGKTLSESPVSAEAKHLGIGNIYKPERIKTDEEVISALAGLHADLFVVCAYGQILSQELLDIPKMGSINIHASLLPRYRGAAPIERCIMDGESQTGISIMRMEKGLDTGPVYIRESTEISDTDTGETLRNRLSAMGADLILKALPGISDRSLMPEAQDDSLSTYAPVITKDDMRINWDREASEIWRLVRSLSPKPGAFSTLSGKVVKIKMTHVLTDAERLIGDMGPGAVLDTVNGAISVCCGHDTVLNIERLQLEGRNEMDAPDFLRGYRLERGELFL